MSTDTVICPECGTESQATVYRCYKCGYQLRSLDEEGEALMELEEESGYERDLSVGGMILAALGGIGVIGIAIWLVATFTEYSEYAEPSAIQVTQLYTEASFWVLVTIGVLLAGILWVVSTRE